MLLVGRFLSTIAMTLHVSSEGKHKTKSEIRNFNLKKKTRFNFSGVYISESVHPNIRGSLVVLPNLFMSLGLLLIWTLAYFFSRKITAYLAMVAPVMLTFFMW